EAPGPPTPCFNISLKPPTEREMLADEARAEAWAREWRGTSLPEGAAVEWQVRAWRTIGRQSVPVRLSAATPDALARFSRGGAVEDWWKLSRRAATLRELFGGTEAMGAVVRSHGTRILGFDDGQFATVCEVTSWLVAHPVSGLRPRQLPIRGVDSKWFGTHRGLVTALHAAAVGREAGGLGIVDAKDLVRVRVLDPALALGGIADFAAPAAQLDVLPYAPRVVFVFENLESVLAMPPWPGAIVVHGSGYAVDVVGRLDWVWEAPILYWGDLDSNGFAILNRLRASHPRVASVLMDEATLLAHRDLWVQEGTPNRGVFPGLTDAERRTLERLRDEGDARLEQERIPWEVALAALERAAHTSPTV
nr:hypothetical protein [Actinomycetales bacterium]